MIIWRGWSFARWRERTDATKNGGPHRN